MHYDLLYMTKHIISLKFYLPLLCFNLELIYVVRIVIFKALFTFDILTFGESFQFCLKGFPRIKIESFFKNIFNLNFCVN